jgi:predicted transcriptional regulator
MTAKRDVVHARLDPETRRTLDRLRRSTGLTDSELIRRALRVFVERETRGSRRRIIGLGEFESGVSDLATNPDHLAGFGRKLPEAARARRSRAMGSGAPANRIRWGEGAQLPRKEK